MWWRRVWSGGALGPLVSGAGIADAAAQPGDGGTGCVWRERSISLIFTSSPSEQIDAMANRFIIQ